mmetsp:Transcript_18708/g.52574  ORF Transcript_18708/g.52574 Transcript_18708/m.52574 type:complete len:141 (+) Transcript_18708:108-530(+)|eukprot:CAMPEP_0202351486 /NCGR_PEP_ID=MMETSP1126-20121109/8103_1 /ASSEMBLY_ACC=CAM_ASM_000457 /TAXON_ID=3047 /ORGANISM="Dunaliella tertiolecta, Strain CCMP1320" /LENGTH=140 /DNA_ID=CAMNT_0048943595 /DNA_START=68 /DNA_END=490 /DNA_ORIENTATION=+
MEDQILPPEEAKSADPEAFATRERAHALSNSEVSIMLEQFLEQKVDKLGTSYQPPAMLKKTKDYAEQFAQTRNEEAVRDMRRVLTERGCHHYEIPIIMNLMPETAEEAIKLLPSLKDQARFPDDSLDQMLEEIIHYRQFQ